MSRIPARIRFPAVCLVFLGAWWTVLAIRPTYRAVWLDENLVVFVCAPLLLWIHRRRPLSNLSVGLLTLFFAFHIFGAHYSYSEVPGFEAARWGWSRNHYDRLVHFLFGLLLAYPMREVLLRVAAMRGFWSCLLPLCVIMSMSESYELLEWGFAQFTAPEEGIAFLGIQGDIWDAQKDTALAALGGLLAMGTTWIAARRA